MTAQLVSIDPELIEVGDRHRTELGDLEALADSVEAVGLLNPITIDKSNNLIAGERRLRAWTLRFPGKPIPAHVVDNLDDAHMVLVAERDENTCRKEFTNSEKVALGLALEVLEKPAADARADEGRKRGGEAASGKVARKPSPEPEQRVRDKVGEAVGLSGRTYEKAKAVVAAADAGVAEAIEAKAEMDETGKVDAPFKKVKQAEKLAAVAERYPFLADVPASPQQVIDTAAALDAVPESEKARRLDSAEKWAEMQRRRAEESPDADRQRAAEAHDAASRALDGLVKWNVDAQRALDRWESLVTDPSMGVDEWSGSIALARQHLDEIEARTVRKLRSVQ